jgi:RNA polymerase sigma factor (TIGR02999 family)
LEKAIEHLGPPFRTFLAGGEAFHFGCRLVEACENAAQNPWILPEFLSMGETRADRGAASPITALLSSAQSGDSAAAERLIELVYAELHRLAGGLMRHERRGHTLQTTVLVHEAIARLLDQGALQDARSRAYFFGAAAQAMRQVLVEHARARGALKRGGAYARVPLDALLDAYEDRHAPILLMDSLLDDLAGRSPRQAQVVVLRTFGGFTMREISEHLGVSLSTVEADWRVARAWLRAQVSEAD